MPGSLCFFWARGLLRGYRFRNNSKTSMNKRILDLLMVLTLLGAFTQAASASVTLPVPDAGSTSAMLGLAFVGLASVRRFIRK